MRIPSRLFPTRGVVRADPQVRGTLDAPRGASALTETEGVAARPRRQPCACAPRQERSTWKSSSAAPCFTYVNRMTLLVTRGPGRRAEWTSSA